MGLSNWFEGLEMDYVGQARAEKLSRIIILLFGFVGFVWGFIVQEFVETVRILGAGFVLAAIVTIPPWQMYRKNPLQWITPRPVIFRKADFISIYSFLKSEGLKLLPFAISVELYFYNFYYKDLHLPRNYAMMLPIFPVASLALFVFLLGLDNSLRKKVFFGLLLSVFGDACLLKEEEEMFIYGIVALGIAQIFFISAHGLTPRKWGVLILILLAALPIAYFVYPQLTKEPFEMQVVVSLYTPLLLGLFWRGVARSGKIKEKDITVWSVECAAFGGSLLLISYAVLAINKFYRPMIVVPYNRLIVMITYYGSLLATALSSYSEGPSETHKFKFTSKMPKITKDKKVFD